MKVPVGISNRHVHLTKEAYDYLFDGKVLEKKKDLNQIGEFASTDTVTLEYNGKEIEHVRIVGPFRSRNQIELLGTDLEFFGLDAPTRRSGDLHDTPTIRIKVSSKYIDTDGVIRAERHIHVPTSKEEELHLHERDRVILRSPKVTFDAWVKVSDNGYFEVHIDKDEATQYGLEPSSEVEIDHVENR